jgi:hypothetical protein
VSAEKNWGTRKVAFCNEYGGEKLDMVKIGFYIVEKRGKKGIGMYEEVCMQFPKELHEFLRCLQHHQLEIKATRAGNITHIMLIDKQP